MHDSKRFLHPEAIKRISRLDLRAHHLVEGFLSGMHRSPYYGESVEFLQHRQYARGDDLRHVDWRVWARQDRLYVKQYEEDTNLRCYLLVDVSASMNYGSGAMSKYEYGCTIAAALAYLVLKQQDAVGCVTFASEIRESIPARSKRNHLNSIIAALDRTDPEDASNLLPVFNHIAETFPRRGIVVVISDLLGDEEQTLKGLRLLRQRGHDVLVFHVMDDDELDFSFDGLIRFEGMESDAIVRCHPRSLRDGYLRELDLFLADLRHGCATNNVDYKLIRTSDALDAVLSEFLHRRIAAHRKK